MGVSQFMPGTWKTWGDGSPYDPKQAIKAQADYNCALAKVVKKYPGDKTNNLLAAYNAGPNAVKRYNGVPPYPETTNYIRRIRAEMKQ